MKGDLHTSRVSCPDLPRNSFKQQSSLDALSHPVKILLSPLTIKTRFQVYFFHSSWLEQRPCGKLLQSYVTSAIQALLAVQLCDPPRGQTDCKILNL